MPTDAQVLAEIDAAFGDVERPEHFTNFSHCEECAEHDELLRTRTRETLSIADVGNMCWQPISFSSPEGIAFYLPSLARLALDPPTYEYGWYGDTLHIHLTSRGADNLLLRFCNPAQRKAIAALLDHLNHSRADLEERITTPEKLEAARLLWAQ